MSNYRLYSFVANHYLSPLQHGLQTAHVVGELICNYNCLSGEASTRTRAVQDWAERDKTIIICGAGNHLGVLNCFETLKLFSSRLDLPCVIFHEDEQSMNRMATACGVVVPEKFWNVSREAPPGEPDDRNYWLYVETAGTKYTYHRYYDGTPEAQFIDHIKQYRLT